MDLSESHLHSFIIKLWLDEATDKAGRTAWRGQIKHVPSGEHRYIKSLDEIADFIRPYLKSEGVDAGHRVRLWKWIGWRRLRR